MSKVLTNRSDVSEQKRREILKIMNELNYRPKRTRNILDTIACVFDGGLRVSSNFGGLLLDSLTRAAFLAGYRFILLPYNQSFESREGLMRFLRPTGIAGMAALFTNERKEDFYKTLLEVGTPPQEWKPGLRRCMRGWDGVGGVFVYNPRLTVKRG